MYNHARIEHNKKGENSHGSAFLPRSEVRELLYEQVLPAQQTESFRLPFSHAFFLIHFYLCRQIKNGSPITRAGALRSGDHFLCLFDCWTIKTDCHASVATLARNVILRSKNLFPNGKRFFALLEPGEGLRSSWPRPRHAKWRCAGCRWRRSRPRGGCAGPCRPREWEQSRCR